MMMLHLSEGVFRLKNLSLCAISFSCQLFRQYGVNRAGFYTCAAVVAGFSDDVVLRIACNNRLKWTFIDASAAGYAITRDFMRHNTTSIYFFE